MYRYTLLKIQIFSQFLDWWVEEYLEYFNDDKFSVIFFLLICYFLDLFQLSFKSLDISSSKMIASEKINTRRIINIKPNLTCSNNFRFSKIFFEMLKKLNI